MQTLHGKRILILRGTADEIFAEQAQQRGAEVNYLECYRRVPIVYPNNEEQAGLCQRAGVQTVIATSIEILLSLMDLYRKKNIIG